MPEKIWIAGVQQIKLRACPLCRVDDSYQEVTVSVVGDEQRITCRICKIEVCVKEVSELA